MNIARLLSDRGKNKSKIGLLSNLCDAKTLFIGLGETFLSNDILDAEINLPGYNLIRCDRHGRIGGGVCFYIKQSINYELCLSYSNSVCDVLVIKSMNPDLLLVNIYRPPNASLADFNDVMSRTIDCCQKFTVPLINIVIVGDFNFPHIDWSAISETHCRHIGKLSDDVNLFFLKQYVALPTRKDNILDLVFSNDDIIQNIDSIPTYISDHNVLHAQTNVLVSTTCTSIINDPTTCLETIDFKTTDWNMVRLSLQTINWHAKLEGLSVDNCLEFINESITQICYQYSKSKSKNSKGISKFHKHRKTLMRQRCRTRKKMKSCDTDSKIRYQSAIKSIEQQICDSHAEEKSQEESRAAELIKSNSNYFFKYAKKYSHSKSSIGPLMDADGTLTNDVPKMCNLLLEQYNSVFSTPTCDKTIDNPYSFFKDHKPEGSMLDIELNVTVICDAIKEMNSNSAAGPDSIPAVLYKECSNELAVPLNILFSMSIEQGVIPKALKSSVIVPVFKGGDRSQPSSYRPISLTPIVMKIFERVVRKQMINFISTKDMFNPSQHGFREGRSCLSALLTVYDNVISMLTNVKSIDMIYLDFAKAFDKVDHNILMHKVRDLGITGKLGIWLNSFLSNRSHQVRLPGGLSNQSKVISGVPQGTVLGPVLFLILMGDISDNINSHIISFADDTRLYAPITSDNDCDILQDDLSKIYKWADVNNMTFNSNKFQYINFTSTNIKSSNAYLSSDSNTINATDTVKDLGISMSHDCMFDTHISHISLKCSQLCGWILRTFHARHSLLMMTLFKSLVISRLDYASQLWSPYKLHHINQIEKIQRSFTKHITGIESMSYCDRLKHLTIYSLQRRRDRYLVIYMWKIAEQLVPNLSPTIDFQKSDRRGRMCYVNSVPANHLGTLCHNSFRWKATRLFNTIPKHLRDITNCSVLCFKKKLDIYLKTITDSPCMPHDDNSLDARIDQKRVRTLRGGLDD